MLSTCDQVSREGTQSRRRSRSQHHLSGTSFVGWVDGWWVGWGGSATLDSLFTLLGFCVRTLHNAESSPSLNPDEKAQRFRRGLKTICDKICCCCRVKVAFGSVEGFLGGFFPQQSNFVEDFFGPNEAAKLSCRWP